jgi:2'-5' RNA ligase
MAEFGLAVPFAELGVELVGIPNDLPPHVTVLYPSPGEPLAIAQVLEPFEGFDVVFTRVDRFPGVLWLAPEPAEPFVAMTEAVTHRFPEWQPYDGVYKSVVPHLTVAQEALDDAAVQIEPLLPLASRVESVVLYESADGRHWREHTTFDLG